jgi:bacillithiol biosynthesis cysteine-adding enzyme BshC
MTVTMPSPVRLKIISRRVAGGELAQRALTGAIDQWYARPPDTPDGWRARARAVAAEFAARDWRARLAGAFDAHGLAAERLARADVVVTTGQQPGLFGGPLYTLHKALTALALADALERDAGVPVAPVFWAATDDSDFAEANHVGVVAGGRYVELRNARADVPDGTSMSATPLGDISAARELLERACGSAANAGVVEVLRRAYAPGTTVGGAYLTFLRALLEPFGIPVLDASHPAVRRAAAPVLQSALRDAGAVRSAVDARATAIQSAGLSPQVAQVADLSLVFITGEDGVRRRVALADAARVAREADPETLSPNVLLRPIVERQILPTLTYVGGAGEIAYFAQSTAVADALRVAVPLVVPRWSGIVVEPEVARALERLGLGIDDLRDPHAGERLVARRGLAPEVRDALTRLRQALRREADTLDALVHDDESLRRSVGSMRATAEFRVERLERRLAAAQKQRGSPELRDVRLAQASLYPGGAPQERVLSFVPLLARFGEEYVRGVITAATALATEIVRGV